MKPIILAIDPGTEKSAFCLWDGEKIREHGIKPNEELAIVVELFADAPESKIIACEHLQSFGMPVGKEIFETGYFIGRLWQIAIDRGIQWERVFRNEVKIHHCKSARAKDSNIRQALIDRFGSPGTKKSPGKTYKIVADEWSAFAIATLVYDKLSKT